jgi:nucleoside-diphosphate-sugar epimerase
VATTSELQVVFGTGPIGLAVIEELARAGRPVRAASRSGDAPLPRGVEARAGDDADPAFLNGAAEGAAVVYQCLNPPYTRWPERFPPLQATALDATTAAQAKLVLMDNLYGYGPTDGRPLTEDLPLAAPGKKGRTRAPMAEELLQSHRDGRVRAAIGRASDYFGPRALVSHMGERANRPLLAGKSAQLLPRPDPPHTYSYLPDIARGLIVIGDRDEALGEAWHIPSPPTVTTREFVERIAPAAGVEPRMRPLPKPLVRVVRCSTCRYGRRWSSGTRSTTRTWSTTASSRVASATSRHPSTRRSPPPSSGSARTPPRSPRARPRKDAAP